MFDSVLSLWLMVDTIVLQLCAAYRLLLGRGWCCMRLPGFGCNTEQDAGLQKFKVFSQEKATASSCKDLLVRAFPHTDTAAVTRHTTTEPKFEMTCKHVLI
ncbi:hypothetical protein XENOCAPTIV_026360 [Xenoophorus captivus]|uniref:Secreted protein n=1 Tax=Xenoophorus captivus TaxID=1517983 RepID=A0ABV0QUZ9_9TELE